MCVRDVPATRRVTTFLTSAPRSLTIMIDRTDGRSDIVICEARFSLKLPKNSRNQSSLESLRSGSQVSYFQCAAGQRRAGNRRASSQQQASLSELLLKR